MFKLRAASDRVDDLTARAKADAKEALAELMADNPGLTYVEAAPVFEALARLGGTHAAYMTAHHAMLPILTACNTEPPGSTERR
jgi:hypothetical protein